MKTIVIIAKSTIAVLMVICLAFIAGSAGMDNGSHGLGEEQEITATPTITQEPTSTPTPKVTPTVTPSPTDTLPPTQEPTETVTTTKTQSANNNTTTKRPTTTKTKKPKPTPTPTPSPHPTPDAPPKAQFNLLVNAHGNTIGTRFVVPDGFVRVPVEEGSFAEYLRNLPLKPDGSQLHYLNSNGTVSSSLVPYDEFHTPAAHAAILDIDMLSSSEQCADTVMHLYADYLFQQGRYDEMAFTFVSRFVCDFQHYISGYRYNASTGKWTYNSSNAKGATKNVFKIWLRQVFTYSNTTSMVRYDLQKVNISKMQIGDMFIQERTAEITTGHVVLVCDMAYNPTTGETRFMTLQGSMPALEAHVMLNAKEQKMSPWQNTYFPDGKFVSATYWSCDVSNLSRFKTQKSYPNVPEVVIPTPSPTPITTPTIVFSPEASTLPSITTPDATLPYSSPTISETPYVSLSPSLTELISELPTINDLS